MQQKHIDKKLGRKVKLDGKRLSEVLSEKENHIVSFWTLVENKLIDKETTRRKEQQEEFVPLSEDEFDAKVDEIGNEILSKFNGIHKDAINSLIV